MHVLPVKAEEQNPLQDMMSCHHVFVLMSCCGHARWAISAIEWMTTQMDIRGEIEDLESAMQVSLREAEQEKQKQKPVSDMAEQELLQRFRGSFLIPKVPCILQWG